MKARKIIAIVLVIGWAGILFYFSHQPGTGSSKTSQKVALEMVKVMENPKASKQDKVARSKAIEPYIRKMAHFSLYLTGGMVIFNAVQDKEVSERKKVGISIVLGVMYAVSDEIHQLFIVGRSAQITDVWIDSLGIMTGIACFMLSQKTIEQIKCKKKLKKQGSIEG